MQRRIITGLVLGAGIAATSMASAFTIQPNHVYFGVNGGYSNMHAIHDTLHIYSDSIDKSNDWGYNGGAALGYTWGNHNWGGFRTDLSYMYSSTTLKTFKENNLSLNPSEGTTAIQSMLLNLYYDVKWNKYWVTYFGVGAGAALIDESISSDTKAEISDSVWAPAYQGALGFGFNAGKNWTFTLDYRFIGTDQIAVDAKSTGTSTDNNGTTNATVESSLKVPYYNHLVNFGVTFHFS